MYLFDRNVLHLSREMHLWADGVFDLIVNLGTLVRSVLFVSKVLA